MGDGRRDDTLERVMRFKVVLLDKDFCFVKLWKYSKGREGRNMAKTTSPFKLFLKTPKNRILLVIAALLVVAAGVVTLLPKKELEKIPERIPEIFPVTGAYQGYFELKTSTGTTAVPQGTEVVVDVYVTTSGEPFDAAVAMVEWDGAEFSYLPDYTIGHLVKSNGNPYSFAATQPEGVTNKLIMAHYTTGAETPMTTTYGQLKKFASFTLVAQADRPSSTVRLSTALDASGNHKDLLVHFVDSTESNSADQTLTSADNAKVEFYLCSSGEAWCDGSVPKTCSADRKAWVSQPDCSLSDQYCSNGSCVDYACDLEEKRCSVDKRKVEACSGDRKSWIDDQLCAVHQECSETTYTCLDIPDYCFTNGETQCASKTQPQICQANRWVNQAACTANQYCSNGSCIEYACGPEEKRCYQDKLQICSADRKDWDLQTDCVANDQYCDLATLTCLAYACETGETRCDGNNPQKCRSDRMDWEASTNEVVCGAGSHCLNGKCIPLVCQYDFDGNGEVGFSDLLYVLANWAEGSIDVFLQVLWGYGTTCS